MEKRAKSNQAKNKNGGLKAKAQKIKAGLLKSYYGNPMKDMKLIAITGTTGKVTVAHYIYEILKKTGEQVAVLASDQPKLAYYTNSLATRGRPVLIMWWSLCQQKVCVIMYFTVCR